jgi:hypothetical protein
MVLDRVEFWEDDLAVAAENRGHRNAVASGVFDLSMFSVAEARGLVETRSVTPS